MIARGFRAGEAPTEPVIRFAAVQAALMRVMNVHPPHDFALHPDASKLTDLFATMWFFRWDAAAVDGTKAEVLEAFERWRLP